MNAYSKSGTQRPGASLESGDKVTEPNAAQGSWVAYGS